MPRLIFEQSSFVGGEVSPLVAARSDVQLWNIAAERMLNFAPLSQGGARTRPGTRYAAVLPSAGVRLEDFVFSEDQRYVLAFDNGTFDAWTADGTPCSSLSGCPWTAGMVFEMSVVVSGDTILVLHPTMQPQRIRRTGATTFVRDAMPIEVPAFARFAAVTISLSVDAVGAAGTTATMTASANYFASGMIGHQIRWKGERATITGVTNATTASVTWLTDSTGTDTSATPNEWFEEAWSAATGWPGCGTFFQNRLVLAGSAELPSGVWISKVGAFFNFDVGTALDDEAISSGVDPNGRRVARVRHAVTSDRLLFMTDAGVFASKTSSQSPITPKSFALVRVLGDAIGRVRPAIFDNAVTWVDQTGRVVRELVWSQDEDGYASSPISLPSEHLIDSPRQMAAYDGSYDRPEALALLVNQGGGMAVFHSVRSEKLAAWVPWTTDGVVRSVAAVGPDIFVAVTREIGGDPVTWLERFDPTAEALDASALATLPDPGRTFTAAAPHLAGRTVACVSRGHYLGEATVAGDGTIDLPEGALDVDLLEAGLAFEQRLRVLPFAMQTAAGPTRTLMKRFVRAIVQADRSGSFRVAGRELLLRLVGDDVATPAPLGTGQFVFHTLGVDREAQFDLVVERPQRVTILGITREVHVSG